MEITVSINGDDYRMFFKPVENNDRNKSEWVGVINERTLQDVHISVHEKNNQLILLSKNNRIENDDENIQNQLNILALQVFEEEQEGFESTIGSLIDKQKTFKPYDPEKIRVDPKNFSIHQIYEMMISESSDIDLTPDFQRNFVWNDITRKSRLIESVLLRIPLPVFYFSQNDEGLLNVVDGVQRLTVLKQFMNNEFKLRNLEYLDQFNGCYFNKGKQHERLTPKYVRRLMQTQITANIIDPSSPAKVKFDIFKRINTGGKPLNKMEIRNCMASPKARNLLRELAHCEEFESATGGVNDTRLTAQELVLRFISFYYEKYYKPEEFHYTGDMESFLDDMLEALNKEDDIDLENIKIKFKTSMKNAKYLFGKYAFRKCLPEHLKPRARKQLINKSLLTSWSVVLAEYDEHEVKDNYSKKGLIKSLSLELGKYEEYYNSVTYGTNDKERINIAFSHATTILKSGQNG
jgi:hypothetical protein